MPHPAPFAHSHSFANFGPNSTTFVIPAELFPSYFRATGHGIAAASGKAGAIVGAFGFGAAVTAIGLQETLGILAGINFLGMLCTFFVPETNNRSLEEMSGDQAVASDGVKAILVDNAPPDESSSLVANVERV